MLPVQQVILEGVRDALVTGATAAGARVFLDRVHPLTRDELPAILVEEAPEGENVDPGTVNGQEVRSYGVLVTCIVGDAQAPDSARKAREMGLEVEKIIGLPAFAIPKPARARIVASRIAQGGAGEVPMAGREQLWRFTYYTRRGAPEQAR